MENTDRNKALKYDKSDVLSVSGEFGIVNQIAFQGRSFAGESVAEYHIVETDDIVYTKSPLKANPYGIIKVNNGNPGIVSTLYAVYHPIDVIPQYIDYYFCNDLRLNKYLKPLVNIGAKHDMKVNNAAVLFGDVYFPNATEQSKIVEFLQILDYRIKKQRALVESLKKYKRGVIRTLLTPEYCKFKDAKWTSARIGDLGSFIKGAPLSKADIADEGTPFILYGELYTTYNEVITQIVRKTKANVEQQYFSQIGDVIIPTSGETPEEISTASCVMVPGVILGGDLNIFRCSKVDGRIISYILNHVVSRNIARIAQGKSVVHVQANELAKIEIAYPDFKTQENMVTLFEAINAKIAQRTKELELLLEQRRALLQQVFI
ncbi:restriction endonuclease subunit S [Ligilactobacillus murinus]|uniref:Restriction endonuclease subunit S n=2 Tax=Ligilactobacillus murinus TaxID=1622 RepID=A0A4Q2AW66_9LACO|nr:restriction endonuclease subunit S [Ligilactobacillus murinus]